MEALGQGVSFSKPGCLVSFVGVERVLGAPFRVIDDDALSGKADLEWLKARGGERSQEIMRLYACLVLETANALARGMTDDPLTFDPDVPTVHEPQIQSLITSYCFDSTLTRLVRLLPPRVVRDGLQKLEIFQAYLNCSDNSMLLPFKT